MPSPSQMPRTKQIEKALASQLDPSHAAQIVWDASQRYNELYAEREQYASRALRQHLEKNILPGVAIYRTLLEETETQERAFELMETVFRDWAAEIRPTMERMGKLPFFYALMRALIKPMTRSQFPEPGWQTEWIEVSGGELSFIMHRCFYKDVLESYGVPEITKLYCWMDDLIYEGVSPHMGWARTKTLGRGDECCDFKFESSKRRP